MSMPAQLYQANRLDLLSRMAGDISHEIKNPLHAMVINLELVRRKVEKGDGAQAIERVAIVEEEVRKVHALANALLEALRPPRDASDTCGFSTVLQELAPLVTARARLARVELVLENDPASAIVPLPAHELRLLLLNLADRAVRVAGPNGAVAFGARTSGDTLTVDVVAATPTLDDTELSWLSDAPVDAEHIDLGLRITRDLVERAGGRIASGPAEDGRHRLSVSLPTTASA